MSEDIYGTDSFGKDFWALVEEVEKQSFSETPEDEKQIKKLELKINKSKGEYHER